MATLHLYRSLRVEAALALVRDRAGRIRRFVDHWVVLGFRHVIKLWSYCFCELQLRITQFLNAIVCISAEWFTFQQARTFIRILNGLGKISQSELEILASLHSRPAGGIGVPLRIVDATLSATLATLLEFSGCRLKGLHSEKLLWKRRHMHRGHSVGRCRIIQKRVPPMPSDKSKDESKTITQIHKPKPPSSSQQLDTSRQFGRIFETPHEHPLLLGLNFMGSRFLLQMIAVSR
ncbi:hypothetical protein FNV43_RR13266 [Rhamnella rubrinervis]|uniref:Uncharacterized protein n=1 Tax=Rhamnella rubrinervis TaxID=2594499 RepID=A0A8K0H0S1_9ROSA|nr:hypothetical protein FNV43_RR13266 [Rhamnella rubrinervis]